jgi:hypothetical protein
MVAFAKDVLKVSVSAKSKYWTTSVYPLKQFGPFEYCGERGTPVFILDRFVEDEHLLEIKQLRPGDSNAAEGDLSYATVTSYLSVIKQVRVKWGTTRLTRIKPVQVQEWLKKMYAAPRPKATSTARVPTWV